MASPRKPVKRNLKSPPKPMRLDPRVKKSGQEGGKLGDRTIDYSKVFFNQATRAEQRRRIETYGPLALGVSALTAGAIGLLGRNSFGQGPRDNKVK